MNLNEIITFLQTSSTKSICVDRCLLSNYPGFVRDLIICRDNILKIEFNVYDNDDGGLIIKVIYKNLKSLIGAVEQYISNKLESWENINKTGWYPELIEKVDFDKSGKKLKHDLIHKKLLLPLNGEKYIIAAGYWRDLAEGKIKEDIN